MESGSEAESQGGLLNSLMAVLSVVFVVSYLVAKLWDRYDEARKRGAVGNRYSE